MFSNEVCVYDFGDKRLWARLVSIGDAISKSMDSILSSCFQSKAEREAAYRFFGNDKITAQGVLESHKPKIIERLVETSDRILALHDTSTFSYPSHPCTKNLGRVGTHKSPGYGLNVHSSVLLNANKNKPIGIAHQSYFYHSDGIKDKNRPVEEKESYRWIEHMEKTHQICPDAIHICDREGDIFEFFQKADEIGAQFIVRQNQDRVLEGTTSGNNDGRISEKLKSAPISGSYEVRIHDEMVVLAVKYHKIRIAPPQRTIEQKVGRTYKPIDLTVIQVRGVLHKGDELSWDLLTNLAINDINDAKLIIGYYTQRWHIELFHKALKTGYSLEEARLEDGKKLQSLIAIISIEALRVYAIMYGAREDIPPDPQDHLSEEEIKIIEILMKKHKQKVNRLTLQEIVEFIAVQGGFCKTKKYPNPGILTFFRGWSRVMNKIEGIKLVWDR